jgi:hypothetical protein
LRPLSRKLLSAFNAFSDEIFSKYIDRIRLGENKILINTVEPFFSCYVIKGQSYPALQKLTRFTEAIIANSEIWQALNKSIKISEMLEFNNPPILNSIIKDIFFNIVPSVLKTVKINREKPKNYYNESHRTV